MKPVVGGHGQTIAMFSITDTLVVPTIKCTSMCSVNSTRYLVPIQFTVPTSIDSLQVTHILSYDLVYSY